MKTLALSLVLLVIVVYIHAVPEEYSNRYESINVDSILNNNRVLSSYIKCIMDEGPCTQEGRLLRKDIPDALDTNCEKCTDSQKKLLRKVSLYVMDKRPDDWQKIMGKFDPKGEHQDMFNKFLKDQ